MESSNMSNQIDQLFQGKDKISKQDLMTHMGSLGMSRDMIDQLPDREFSKNELMQYMSESQQGGQTKATFFDNSEASQGGDAVSREKKEYFQKGEEGKKVA
jgi:hypothetical protein